MKSAQRKLWIAACALGLVVAIHTCDEAQASGDQRPDRSLLRGDSRKIRVVARTYLDKLGS
ncbi:MAG: hypothetical protein ABIR96_08015 [Bdellovibrionota bacterium]